MEKQYVIFKLEKEEYGVEINHVQEITEHKTVTSVPNTPAFIEGIINLRGSIVPIVSIKKRFNLAQEEVGEDHRIIIINLEEKQVGFIVDDASQVLTISEEQIEKAPEVIAGADREYITGIGKISDKIILLLDLEKILTENEKNEIIEMEE
ncbi:purine-binding chemotaxis protein CheW [Tindallia magadiensis]|uniref:Chemotaxis protein CheW n=1 Tax=Tindallia magadiensis TaxID=69895 RepID=A0A1I3FSJ9_9FIRM|nr:chemotaxis protein CheW [Tindallia magadiensis]SFI14196.1 purine-binding chemotaxis protein CheW [Tindallia magadiensis]